MLSTWRIVKQRHVRRAFDGEGARRRGGRWNSPGTAVVYTSESESLAILEILVHLESAHILRAYSLIECRFEPALVVVLEPAILPKTWRSSPPPHEMQALGDKWITSGNSAVLAVPSVVVPREFNFLLNPAHSDFSSIEIGEPENVTFDERLVKQAPRS